MYEEYFNLQRKPFQLSPDAKFFYPSAEHTKALSFLQYGVSQGDGFIVITGNVGTGKTTLVQALLDDLDQSELSVATIVTSNLGEQDMLQMVGQNFGLPVADANKATLIKALEQNFKQQASSGRRILLIVDEAQNLPSASVEELRMLSNFQMDGRPLVQIFLLGQQEFRTTLLSEGFEQLRQRVIATHHLNPLTEEETRTYIEHRLEVAGWAGNPSFEDEAHQLIFNFSEGVPRRINNLCDRLLLYAFLEEISAIDKSVVESVSNEIGNEFFGGATTADAAPVSSKPAAAEVFDTPEMPLENLARNMFDKAGVQKRLSTLERAVDSLGHNLKPEVAEIRQELGFIRLMLDEIMHEVREISEDKRQTGKKKSA